jgi:hypothetical protein
MPIRCSTIWFQMTDKRVIFVILTPAQFVIPSCFFCLCLKSSHCQSRSCHLIFIGTTFSLLKAILFLTFFFFFRRFQCDFFMNFFFLYPDAFYAVLVSILKAGTFFAIISKSMVLQFAQLNDLRLFWDEIYWLHFKVEIEATRRRREIGFFALTHSLRVLAYQIVSKRNTIAKILFLAHSTLQ